MRNSMRTKQVVHSPWLPGPPRAWVRGRGEGTAGREAWAAGCGGATWPCFGFMPLIALSGAMCVPCFVCPRPGTGGTKGGGRLKREEGEGRRGKGGRECVVYGRLCFGYANMPGVVHTRARTHTHTHTHTHRCLSAVGGLEEAQAQAEELVNTRKDIFSAAFPSARAQVCLTLDAVLRTRAARRRCLCTRARKVCARRERQTRRDRRERTDRRT